MKRKVFGIGLSKTGTTSLTAALRILGYRTLHYPPLDRLDALLETVDAATDTSIACCYRRLDTLYGSSRFILTVRDEASWLRSAQAEFAGRPVTERWKREVRRRVYGSEVWDPALFLLAFRAHNRNAVAYFCDRPEQLLVFDMFRGDTWSPLCAFLGEPIPGVPFPHENATVRTSTRAHDAPEGASP